MTTTTTKSTTIFALFFIAACACAMSRGVRLPKTAVVLNFSPLVRGRRCSCWMRLNPGARARMDATCAFQDASMFGADNTVKTLYSTSEMPAVVIGMGGTTTKFVGYTNTTGPVDEKSTLDGVSA